MLAVGSQVSHHLCMGAKLVHACTVVVSVFWSHRPVNKHHTNRLQQLHPCYACSQASQQVCKHARATDQQQLFLCHVTSHNTGWLAGSGGGDKPPGDDSVVYEEEEEPDEDQVDAW